MPPFNPPAGPNLAAKVRELLMEQRQAGVDFDTAWDRATYSVLGEERRRPTTGTTELACWRIAIDGCRAEFRAAYLREPSRVSEALRCLSGFFEEAGLETSLGRSD